MADVAWEPWVLGWLAAFQFMVAYWWWKGPHLAGTRIVVPALFALNGLATLAASLAPLISSTLLTAIAAVADRWTNLLLLGVGLAALRAGSPWRRAAPVLLALGALALLVATPPTAAGTYEIAGDPHLYVLVVELPLIGGILLAVGALSRHVKTLEHENVVWLLVIGAVGIRYAELAIVNFLPRVLDYSQAIGPVGTINAFMGLATFIAMVFAFGTVLLFRHKAGGTARRALDTLAGLLLAGFLVGAARIGQMSISTAMFFTLAFVRPALFIVAQAELAGPGVLRYPRGHHVAVGALVFLASLLGLLVAEGLWGMGPLRSMSVGGALALIAYSASTGLVRGLAAIVPPPASRSLEPTERRWPIDTHRVRLSEGWEQIVEDNYAAYLALPAQAKANVAKLARWQRLLLAIDAVPEDAPPNAFELTTPGLHLVTHCPYNSIGSEIARANDRCQAILAELGLPSPSWVGSATHALVKDTWGQAEGLRSGRVKLYATTRLGREVAARIREMAGMARLPPGQVRAVVAEGFGRSG